MTGRITVEEIIKADNIIMRYGDFTAVDGLSLTVRSGEIFGFLGPNGAGKTTTIKMLTTMLRPDLGTVSVAGYDTYHNYREARKNIGIIQQHNSLDKDISVHENIKHHALMHGLSRADIPERISKLSGMMELDEYLDRKVETLSGGWKKRVSIVCSMVHDPTILFMDEPTTGLDTQSRNMLWELIRKLNQKGTTIFLTTHYISEAETLCDRVGIINKGKLIALGTNDEIRNMIGTATVEHIDNEGVSHNKYFRNRADARSYMQGLPEDHNVSLRRTDLEDVFLELTGRKL
jgi:ABC-2 type transport system ATP-binding protein